MQQDHTPLLIRSFLLITLFFYSHVLHADQSINFGNNVVNAADKGFTNQVASLIDASYNINATGTFSTTALMRASYRGHYKIAKLLVEAGAKTNMKDLGGATALHFASRQNHPKIVQLLINHGADINSKDNEGWTPLMRAAISNYPSITNTLLSNKANIAARNYSGKTALYYAIYAKNHETTQQILDRLSTSNNNDIKTVKNSLIIAKRKQDQATAVVLYTFLQEADKIAKQEQENQRVAQEAEEKRKQAEVEKKRIAQEKREAKEKAIENEKKRIAEEKRKAIITLSNTALIAKIVPTKALQNKMPWLVTTAPTTTLSTNSEISSTLPTTTIDDMPWKSTNAKEPVSLLSGLHSNNSNKNHKSPNISRQQKASPPIAINNKPLELKYGIYFIQIGSFPTAQEAINIRNQAANIANTIIIPTTINGKTFHRVRIGPFVNRRAAREFIQTQNIKNEFGYATIVK
jgi:cell division septation protein DedD